MNRFSLDAQLNVMSLIRHHYTFLEKDANINDLKKMFSPRRFAIEMGTLVFRSLRGFGHSRITTLLYDIYDPILIITPKARMAELIRRDLREFYAYHKDNNKIQAELRDNVICADRLDTPLGGRPLIYGLPEHYFKMCVVDEASHLTQKQTDLMYEMLSPYVNMFTLLG